MKFSMLVFSSIDRSYTLVSPYKMFPNLAAISEIFANFDSLSRVWYLESATSMLR